jgi:hypothetical protein
MAINQNHTFEDLDGIKCGIVEKNVMPDRVKFLKNLLEFNQYTVLVVPSPPPKITTVPPTAPALAKGASTEVAPGTATPTQNQSQPEIPTEAALVKGTEASIAPVNESIPEIQPQPVPPTPTAPETFTVGVTDVTFNPINAIFGRLLHTRDGHVVSLAYWQQKEEISNDEIPYFDNLK